MARNQLMRRNTAALFSADVSPALQPATLPVQPTSICDEDAKTVL